MTNRNIRLSDSEFIEQLMTRSNEQKPLEVTDYSDQLSSALQLLGERWILHPSNGPAKKTGGANG
jgi:hypothetical protein